MSGIISFAPKVFPLDIFHIMHNNNNKFKLKHSCTGKQTLHTLKTYYFCVLSTFPQLLHRIRVLYIVHGDGVNHHNSVILPVRTLQSIINVYA